MKQKSAKELVAEASKQIKTLAAAEAVKLAGDERIVCRIL